MPIDVPGNCAANQILPGAKRRPLRRMAESVLQDLDLLLEELDLHGLVADLGL
jgi:hypothetical protein